MNIGVCLAFYAYVRFANTLKYATINRNLFVPPPGSRVQCVSDVVARFDAMILVVVVFVASTRRTHKYGDVLTYCGIQRVALKPCLSYEHGDGFHVYTRIMCVFVLSAKCAMVSNTLHGAHTCLSGCVCVC